jgi:polyisoprenyl-teichoic acid--peptidoglycan teichoic acid transferase
LARGRARSWGAGGGDAGDPEAAAIDSEAAEVKGGGPGADPNGHNLSAYDKVVSTVRGSASMAAGRSHQQRSARQRATLRLLAAGLGLLGGMTLLGLVWPASDRAVREQDSASAAALGDLPSRPITVLLIGSDADRRGATTNQAAPPGPANGDALMLVRVDPKGPLQVLSLPVETAVRLPGDKQPVALGSLYRRGGPALVAGAVAELVQLPQGQPDRYLVLPRGALRELVDGLGRVELAPDRSMRYQDKAQRYRIQLEGGLQVIDGRQMEQLLRFKDEQEGEARRRERQQMAVDSLLRQMGQSQQLQQLPDLLARLQNQVDSNLTQSEALSLLAATLQQSSPVRFSTLPLKPPLKTSVKPAAKGAEPLRQLDSNASERWPN